MPSWSIDLRFIPWDVAANVLLFFPLGLALGGAGPLQAGRWGAMLSMGVEAIQFCLDYRYPQPSDVFANTLGAVCGAAVGRWLEVLFGWRFDLLLLGRAAVIGAALPVMVFSAVFHYRASVWTWDESFKLAVGAEPTQSRKWEGQIFEIAIFNVPLDPGFIRTLADEGPGSIAANRPRFPAAPVFERTTPLDLEHLRGLPLLEGNDAQDFFHSLTKKGDFTVLLWCRPARLNQFGPARIVTYSLGASVRNFTIGQEGRKVEFRVRTLGAGPNGFRIYASSAPILNEDEDVLLAALYDGKHSRIYVNGHLAQEADLSETSLFWLAWSLEFLPGMLTLLGGVLTIVLLGLTRPRDHRLRWCIAGLAGGAAGIFFLATGGGGAHPFLGPFVALLAPLGAFAVLAGTGPRRP